MCELPAVGTSRSGRRGMGGLEEEAGQEAGDGEGRGGLEAERAEICARIGGADCLMQTDGSGQPQLRLVGRTCDPVLGE